MRLALDVSAIPTRPAGAGVYVMELARALGRLGAVELVLVASQGDAARWEAMAPAAEVRAVAPRPRPLRLAWEQARAPALARALRCDVWHGPHYTLPLRARTPSVVTVHDLTFFDHPEWHEPAKVAFFRRMIRLSTTRADLVVCVSGYTAERLRRLLRPRAPVVAIHHGVDHGRFRPDGAEEDDLARLRALGVRPPFIAFAGTVEPRKDVPALVAAFGQVAPTRPGLELVIAGHPAWGTVELDAALGRSPVASRIRRLGYVDAPVVPALFRRAEVVAYPSLVEGFGLPALEALACGAALVTTAGSAMSEVVGDAAVLVPPGDRPALVGALARLLDDPRERARLRAAGPHTAAPHTWARCAEAHVEAYHRAAARAAPRSPAAGEP